MAAATVPAFATLRALHARIGTPANAVAGATVPTRAVRIHAPFARCTGALLSRRQAGLARLCATSIATDTLHAHTGGAGVVLATGLTLSQPARPLAVADAIPFAEAVGVRFPSRHGRAEPGGFGKVARRAGLAAFLKAANSVHAMA